MNDLFVQFVDAERVRVQTATGDLTKEELLWQMKEYSPDEPSRAMENIDFLACCVLKRERRTFDIAVAYIPPCFI